MTLRDAHEYRQMAALIKERIAGRRAAYFTIPGNLGDALIEAGALEFFKQYDIAYSRQNSRRLQDLHAHYYKLAYAKNLLLKLASAGRYEKYALSLRQIADSHDTAIICGSGSFVRQYPVAMQIYDLCTRWFSDVIVLPSTYSMTSYRRGNTLFFARDKFESLNVVPTATFCHDMAFFLRPDPIEPRQRVGFHVRTDNESSGKLPRVPGNIDVSLMGTATDPASLMFDEVGKSEIVVTDRLHVCIAAALLGRQVYLFRGNYFKIEAIFKSSIAPHYPNVSLLDDWAQLPAALRP
jgi:exopolysaccharide biosynthesis predicted pyruvyltransferase EpsI